MRPLYDSHCTPSRRDVVRDLVHQIVPRAAELEEAVNRAQLEARSQIASRYGITLTARQPEYVSLSRAITTTS